VSDWRERLSEAMLQRGMSGGDLARKTNLSSQYINSLRNKDRGARPPLETARRLASALEVSVEWLMGSDGQPSDPGSRSTPLPPSSRSAIGSSSDPYTSRAVVIALLTGSEVAPAVIAALRQVLPDDPAIDPGNEFWIHKARALTLMFRTIQEDPVLRPASQPAPERPATQRPATQRPDGAPGSPRRKGK
jgi:transcriptional regulator with XRE-family HTH domain